MFYRTDEPHGLPHNPFNALVVPRPIGWISSQDAEGNVNLAPYSFFNGVAYTPPQVMFSTSGPHTDGGLKDTISNIHETGEFVVNIATWALRHAVNETSTPAPRHVDEFEAVGLEKENSQLVSPPRVAASPIHLECIYNQTVELEQTEPDVSNLVVFGTVIGIHIDDDIMVDGMVDLMKADVVARLGYRDYTRVTDFYSLDRPGWPMDK
jgi:flavin reductase (DIM6/NTAB) family NADH-FMN oxidoreductase RutF